MKETLIALLVVPVSAAASGGWPGLPPDCWSGSRMVHSIHGESPWQQNMAVLRKKDGKPKPGQVSPNNGYFFVVEGDGRPTARITIYAEKEHLIEISFSDLFGLSDIKWINEKLLFMRPWWGRIMATDIIFDVETEKVIHAETVTDAFQAYQQYRESCPILGGCECIKKE